MNEIFATRFSLAGRRAVVTGGASGIGRQTAIVYAQAGAAVVLVDIDAAGLDSTRRELEAVAKAEVTSVRLDMRDRDAVEAVAARAEALGSLDVWANVAGILSIAPVVDVQPDELERVLSVNLKGTFHGCAAAARVMTKQGRGAIINVSSAAADWPGPGYSVYAMTKAAIVMLTKSLAHEVGPAGVRVNAVAPGFIDTPMVRERFRGKDARAQADAFFDMRAGQTVIRRVGTADDVASSMLYLASDASDFMTGQVMRPNGGLAMP